MAAPPANVGPGTTPGANQGLQAAATLDIQNGLKMLQRALPNVPMGTPLHTDILKAVGSIAKHMGEAGGEGGLHASGMMQMLKQQAAQAPQLAAMRAMGGGPTNPGGPPATPAPPMPPPEPAAA
jgi:hypothetical protein